MACCSWLFFSILNGNLISEDVFPYITDLIYSYIDIDTHDDFELAKSILLITSLSPLTLGWSRQILMEPLISTIGVFYLANVLKIFFEDLTII